MNQNIEVINENLWAVKFSLIPFIKELEYTPDQYIPAYEEPGRISNEGIIILNKDHKGYSILKSNMIQVIKKSDRNIKRELKINKELVKKDQFKIFYLFTLQFELERRQKRKRVNK